MYVTSVNSSIRIYVCKVFNVENVIIGGCKWNEAASNKKKCNFFIIIYFNYK
jgi:hypothetical protein